MSAHPNSATQKLLKAVFYRTLDEFLPNVLIKEAFDYISIDVSILQSPLLTARPLPPNTSYIQWNVQFIDGHSYINGVFLDVP